MVKQTVVSYKDGSRNHIELLPDQTFNLYTNGINFTASELEDLHKFLGDVLADLGAPPSIMVPRTPDTNQNQPVVTAPRNPMFAPNPDNIPM